MAGRSNLPPSLVLNLSLFASLQFSDSKLDCINITLPLYEKMMNSTTLTSSSLPSSSSLRPLPQRSYTAPETILSTIKLGSSSNGGGTNISTACEDQCRRMNRKRPLSAVEWHSALDDNSGKAIVLLKVQSALGSKCQGPVIREGMPIVGNVELNFSKPEYVEEILLTVSDVFHSLSKLESLWYLIIIRAK